MLGDWIEEFHVPVCNIFRPKILNKQLCFEVDINQYKDTFSASNLKIGLTFFVDLNEDRQFDWKMEGNNDHEEG